MNTDRIEKQVLLRAPMARVWRALADSTEFGTWFGMKFDGPLAPGAVMRGVITPNKVDAEVAKQQEKYDGIPFEFTIQQMEPERLFSFRWHPGAIEPIDYSLEPTTLVEFKLDQEADGVRLTITESGFDQVSLERRAKVFADNDGGWGGLLVVIDKYVTHAQ